MCALIIAEGSQLGILKFSSMVTLNVYSQILHPSSAWMTRPYVLSRVLPGHLYVWGR